jgi:O-methyltransferase
MSSKTLTDPYAKPSLMRTLATPVLYGLHAVLPNSTYQAIYAPAFASYKAIIRRNYRARLAAARRMGDARKVECMERVLAVMEHSLVGTSGLEHTHDLAREAVENAVPGAFVECGVAQGGCAALLATVAASDERDRDCWFFDSYEGLPDPTQEDYESGRTGRHVRPLPKGSCLGSYEQVAGLLFDRFAFERERVHMVKGWFQDTLPSWVDRIGPIAILRIDGDWYASTKCCLETLFPAVSAGGHVIIDDYFSCFGARKATDEFIDEYLRGTELVPDGRGGASFRKP